MISEELKKEIENIKKIEGECRGVSIQSPLDYICFSYGEEALQKIETELEDLEIPTKKINALEKYPIGYMTALHLIIKEVMAWDYNEMKKMGYALPQLSFILKTFSRYLLSVEKIFEESSNYWGKHFTIGNLVPVEINREEKYLVIQIKDFNTHPVDCFVFRGYFARMLSYTLKANKIDSEEKKCMHNDDDFHEFYIYWN